MKDIIEKSLIGLIPVFIGAWDIYGAINSFIERKYFAFGFELMLTIWMICLFIKIFFEL